MSSYDDIINLPHHKCDTRPQMNSIDRAAQFAPFAALKGYDEAVIETARLTQKEIILDDDEIFILNQRLNIALNSEQKVAITYFEPDKLKKGGAYIQKIGNLISFDAMNMLLIMSDDSRIKIKYIVDVELI